MCLLVVFAQAVMVPESCCHLALKGVIQCSHSEIRREPKKPMTLLIFKISFTAIHYASEINQYGPCPVVLAHGSHGVLFSAVQLIYATV